MTFDVWDRSTRLAGAHGAAGLLARVTLTLGVTIQSWAVYRGGTAAQCGLLAPASAQHDGSTLVPPVYREPD